MDNPAKKERPRATNHFRSVLFFFLFGLMKRRDEKEISKAVSSSFAQDQINMLQVTSQHTINP